VQRVVSKLWDGGKIIADDGVRVIYQCDLRMDAETNLCSEDKLFFRCYASHRRSCSSRLELNSTTKT
jgi:hypothetical protein